MLKTYKSVKELKKNVQTFLHTQFLKNTVGLHIKIESVVSFSRDVITVLNLVTVFASMPILDSKPIDTTIRSLIRDNCVTSSDYVRMFWTLTNVQLLLRPSPCLIYVIKTYQKVQWREVVKKIVIGYCSGNFLMPTRKTTTTINK